jgi:outer membrane protein assembly factor BamE (lipoprotein component of BamABCDE complex)
MTKTEVLEILGNPIKSDLKKGVDEWFYCKTGIGADEHLAVYFFEGKVIAKKNYSVTVAEVNNVTGSCELFIKRGNYREPDEVREIRLKFGS